MVHHFNRISHRRWREAPFVVVLVQRFHVLGSVAVAFLDIGEAQCDECCGENARWYGGSGVRLWRRCFLTCVKAPQALRIAQPPGWSSVVPVLAVLCPLVPTWVFPRWRSRVCQCRRFVSPVSHVELSTLVFAGFLQCSLVSLASFSVCGRDDHQTPQQVSQSGEEGRLPHVTDCSHARLVGRATAHSLWWTCPKCDSVARTWSHVRPNLTS